MVNVRVVATLWSSGSEMIHMVACCGVNYSVTENGSCLRLMELTKLMCVMVFLLASIKYSARTAAVSR